MHAWAQGAGRGLEIHMQGLSQEPAGRQTTDTQHDTCPSTGGAPETWALARGGLGRAQVVMVTVRGAAMRQHRAPPSPR